MGAVQREKIRLGNGGPERLGDEGRLACSPLEEAFRRWQDELLGMLYILLGSLREAQEAFAETFLYCWAHRDLLSSLQDRKLWIFRAALETARQRRATAWRRRWRLWNLDSADRENQAANPSNLPPPEENCSPQVAFWRRVLMELPPEELEVFLLRQNAQMSYEQIADLLQSPLGVVKIQMRRAVAKLREAAGAQSLAFADQPPTDGSLPLAPAKTEALQVRILPGPSGSPAEAEDQPKPQTIPILPRE